MDMVNLTPEGAGEEFSHLHAAAWRAGEEFKTAVWQDDSEAAKRAVDVVDAIHSELYPEPLPPHDCLVARVQRYTNGGA